MRPSELIDPADRLLIERAVYEAEQETAGEIVVVVARACDDYASVGWRAGVLLGTLAFLGLALVDPRLHVLAYLGVQAAGLALGHLATRIGAIRRLFLTDGLMEAMATRRAISAFAENGLRRTAGQTGILIFVALLEHRVVVLGDEGVNRLLDPGESWQDVVDRILAGIGGERATEGIVAGVKRCGEILAHHLPAPARYVDELPRALVLED